VCAVLCQVVRYFCLHFIYFVIVQLTSVHDEGKVMIKMSLKMKALKSKFHVIEIIDTVVYFKILGSAF
jgi:hypothetical protein